MDGWMDGCVDKENCLIWSLPKCKERSKRVIVVPILLVGKLRQGELSDLPGLLHVLLS